MRKGEVFLFGRLAGVISEDSDGIFRFAYNAAYLASENPLPVSQTMPLTTETYESDRLFPFFDGLIPEGWLLDIAEKSWKLDSRDRMGLLLSCCRRFYACPVCAFAQARHVWRPCAPRRGPCAFVPLGRFQVAPRQARRRAFEGAGESVTW